MSSAASREAACRRSVPAMQSGQRNRRYTAPAWPGSRPPGSWGLEANPVSIDDGTSCRAPSPTPGSIGVDDWNSHQGKASRVVPGPSSSIAPLETVDDLKTAVADFRRSERWSRLQPHRVSAPRSAEFWPGSRVRHWRERRWQRRRTHAAREVVPAGGLVRPSASAGSRGGVRTTSVFSSADWPRSRCVALAKS